MRNFTPLIPICIILNELNEGGIKTLHYKISEEHEKNVENVFL